MPAKTFTYAGWTFTSEHNPISNAAEIDETLEWLEARAKAASNGTAPAPGLHTVPEMYFGSNRMTVKHNTSGLQLTFEPRDALARVEVGPEGKRWKNIKVAAAQTWQRRIDQQRSQRRGGPGAAAGRPPVQHADSGLALNGDENPYYDTQTDDIHTTPKPYDWTFSTDYVGDVASGTVERTDQEIPLDKLRVREPILFFDENVLFEDELGDNGVSKYSIKIRVMPSGFFILARQFLRVDNVMFALHDTRLYHAFGTTSLLREYSARSVDYAAIRDRAVAEAGPSPVSVSPMLARRPMVAATPSRSSLSPGIRMPPTLSVDPLGAHPATTSPVGGVAGAAPGANEWAEPDPAVANLMVDEQWVTQAIPALGEPTELRKERVLWTV
ncbi:Tap42 interacting protein [Blastocladiella emersonii ATCC 22665]|nr:Tap42 interacting protein [Blastocladiella emersonii ATCC 22665]